MGTTKKNGRGRKTDPTRTRLHIFIKHALIERLRRDAGVEGRPVSKQIEFELERKGSR